MQNVFPCLTFLLSADDSWYSRVFCYFIEMAFIRRLRVGCSGMRLSTMTGKVAVLDVLYILLFFY